MSGASVSSRPIRQGAGSLRSTRIVINPRYKASLITEIISCFRLSGAFLMDVVITLELNMMIYPLPEEKPRLVSRQTDTLLLCRKR